jgi:hypothetical protein
LKELQWQTKYAQSVAVNNTIADTQNNAISRTHAMFKIRTGWLRRGGYGIQARFSKPKMDPIEGRVFVHEGTWWMKHHEEGGMRTGADVPFVVQFPMRGRKRTEGPPQRVARKGFNVPLYESVPMGTRRQMKPVMARGARFRIGDVFFVRTGPGKRDIKAISVFKTAVHITARWGFYADNIRYANERLPYHMDVAMNRAIAKAMEKAA